VEVVVEYLPGSKGRNPSEFATSLSGLTQGLATMEELNARKSGSLSVGGDVKIHRLGFGAMRITGPGVWGPPWDRAEAIRTLKRLPELGIDFIDTADSCGPDVSEELIREALHPYDGILVATKAGLRRLRAGVWEPDGRPEHLKEEAIKRCRKLGLEQIGLWQLHSIDAKVPRDKQFAAVSIC
jgi:aryl-alcohol dehydrogenase-like predicted oxidoreductase